VGKGTGGQEAEGARSKGARARSKGAWKNGQGAKVQGGRNCSVLLLMAFYSDAWPLRVAKRAWLFYGA
jgi:hypothetical protein